jgi:urease accessory protein
MNTPASTLLKLIWLASPALPVGGFSYSEGLEAAVDAGLVHDTASAERWLTDQLQLTLGRADLPCIAEAITAWSTLDVAHLQATNSWLLQTRETHEMRLQTVQMGRSLVDWLAQDESTPEQHVEIARQLPACFPVAFALGLSAAGASARDGLLAYGFGWAENMVQAALKAVPLGQTAGQKVLSRLSAQLPAVIDYALSTPPGRRQSFSPMLAILSSQHENQYARLFRS